ncbi:hypothetical protein AB0N07_40470 [Streptomyces sp. NPDC051172]|uniref:hypothetical protein n=1 Tax=Streptomyces sp. NPDC051172 TaxID=3155796 RepID=UPI00342678FF
MTKKAYSLVRPAVSMWKKSAASRPEVLGAYELAPGRGAAASSGCGAEAGAAQDAGDGGGADAVAQAPQLALDTG